MKVVVLTPRASAPVSRSIIDALKDRGVTVVKLNPGRIVLDIEAGNDDVVAKYFSGDGPRGGIVRGIGTSKIRKIYYRLGVFHAFEECGVYLINSKSCLESCTNKAITSMKLARAGIQTPRTVLCEGFKRATQAFKDLGGDVVLKPLFGSKGVGVMRLTDEGFASNVFYNLDRIDDVYYLQEFKDHGNEDVRVMVLGGQVLCAMKRVSSVADGNSWKTNVFVGAVGMATSVNGELEEMAIKASEVVGGDFTGVDLIETRDGPLVIEVNAVPGFTELQKTTKVDIPGSLADFLLEKIKK